ncbi:MAG: pantetheine-phosphate adenylyltransferase [Muribaculaceae bacterium]
MKLFFSGSFRPFTVGHADLVRRALSLGADVVIGVGVNVRKDGDEDEAAVRCKKIAELYADCPRVSVITYTGLTAVAASEAGCDAILRGVRSVKDFEYEREMADINRRINGMDTLTLFADPGLACISSSMVRELEAFGFDAAQYLPGPQSPC